MENKEFEMLEKDRATVRQLMMERKFREASNYINKYPDDVVMQSQKMNIFIKQKKYKEAMEIGSREIFKENVRIQSQMIKIAIKMEDFKAAMKIASNKEYENNDVIQSQKMAIFMAENNFEEAKKIGERKEFFGNESTQSQMITIAMREGDLERAKEIGSRKIFEDAGAIQSQMITIAIKEGKFENAREIANREINGVKIFENYPMIQSQMINIAIIQGDLEKAKELCSKELSKNIKSARKQMKYINFLIKKQGIANKKEDEEINLNQIKTKIYYDRITEEDIRNIKNNKTLSEKMKMYVLLAIYEKSKRVESAKELIQEYRKNKNNQQKQQDIKNLNIIFQKITSKKQQIFDYSFYDKILNWKIDEKLKQTYENEINRKQKDKDDLCR